MEKCCIKKVKALCVQLFFYYFCRKTIIHLLMKNVMRFLSAFAALSFSSLYAVSQESAAFLEPTVVTVVEKTTGNDIKDENKETVWRIDVGTDAQDNDDCYLFWPSNIISMRESFNIGNYTSIEINLGLGTLYGFDPEDSNLEIGIAYQSGDTVRSRTNIVSGKSRQDQTIVFSNLKKEQGEIYIKSVSDNEGICTLLYDVTVFGVNAAPEASVAPDYSSSDITVSGMDYWITSLYMPDRSNDTIYYNDFSEGDLKGAETYPATGVYVGTQNYFYLHDNTHSDKISVVIPLELNNVSGRDVKLKVSFKAAKDGTNACDKIKVYFDNELFTEYDSLPVLINTADYLGGWNEYELEYTTNKRRLDLIISMENSSNKYLLLDDICVRSGMYSYVEAEGYPVKVDGETFRFDNLAPNTEYVYAVQGVTGGVVTDIGYYSFTTEGEDLLVKSGETYELTEDFKGNIRVEDGGCITGTHSVLGEICYVLKYETDKWRTLSLPFKPFLVGAYSSEGEGIYLRAGYDFYLQQYEVNDTDNSASFVNVDEFERGQGYVFKVPATISAYKDHTIYVFSDKSQMLNEQVEPLACPEYDFVHVGNPYTYDVPAKELCDAPIYYLFDGSKFVRSSGDSIVKPLDSFIGHKTQVPERAPVAIEIGKVLGVGEHCADADLMVLIYDDYRFSLRGYTGRVKVYDASGMVVFDGNVSEEDMIETGRPGVYLLQTERGYKIKVLL